MKNNLSIVAPRVLLGLIYFVFGLNFFLHFIPQSGPAPVGAAAAFTGGLFQSGYFFPFLKSLEVVFGLLLLIGWLVPLSLIVLMPISVNILLFHLLLTPAGFPVVLSLAIVVLNLIVAWHYRNYYLQLFKVKAHAV